MHLSPAEYVVFIFGGVRATARALDKYPSTISRWQSYIGKEGIKGRIPSSLQSLILEKAKKQKLDITADDLISGRNMSKYRLLKGPEKCL